jgi:hypothetical protein
MLAQVVLTPTESKKLIATAIANMDIVKRAKSEGMILIHPSSSTYFIIEALMGIKPETNYWVCGVVAPRGMCVEMGIMVGDYLPKTPDLPPGDFKTWWVIKNGKLAVGEKVSELLKSAKSTDVFIKGVNAIDAAGNVGILIGDPAEGGPIGHIIAAWKRNPFKLVFPVGLEKLIPTSISQAVQEAKQTKYDYGMGLAAGLFPCPSGENVSIVSEIDAIKTLSGATAIPIAAGGVGGAEGAITFILKGDEGEVKKAIEFVEQAKGAKLPSLRLCNNCKECPSQHCRFPVGDKHWVKI